MLSEDLRRSRCVSNSRQRNRFVLQHSGFSEQLAQGIPNTELAILEHGGHAFVVESADTVAKVMLDFLAKHRQRIQQFTQE